MMQVKHNKTILSAIGHTPLIAMQRLAAGYSGRILLKMESHNPLGSVKDRIGLSMIEAAESKGMLHSDSVIVEATSGNTGIALAFVGAVKGYKVMLAMPDNMSVERMRLLRALGAKLMLTSVSSGMSEAVKKAEQLVHTVSGAVLMQQFSNPANPLAHELGTGPEIWQDSGNLVDVFISGVGTGGILTGVGRALRKVNPMVELIAVEPQESPVLSGGKAHAHRIQGIGAGFTPPILEQALINRIIPVRAEDAEYMVGQLARQEGIIAGISAGANVWAAMQLMKDSAYAGKTIVTMVCDTGDRYLSTWVFDKHGGLRR